ncbi:MAG: universal stress protein [Microthrixaceae bacterium]
MEETAPPGTLLLATDGSEHATEALVAGLRVAAMPPSALLVTVVPAADPGVVIGSGHAGPLMTPAQLTELIDIRQHEATDVLGHAATVIAEQIEGLDLHTQVLAGDPGEEICRAATERGVAGIVIGTHGLGGIKRALLGSVSDYVVRHAPCPVITVSAS